MSAMPSPSRSPVASAVALATANGEPGAGVNPFTLTGSGLPELGSPWRATLHCNGVSPGRASLFFFAAPSSGRFVVAGEVLVDLSSPHLLTLARAPASAARSVDLVRPPDLLLCGATATCQGLCIGSGEARLSNAIDLRFGR